MAHLVDDKCINCKHTTCVSVCPVDCFYEGPNMLVINPEECIDCGVCIPECPEEAIFQTDNVNDPWYKHNQYFANEWPNVSQGKDPMPEYEKYSSAAGWKGDKTKFFKAK